jgi:hypothetical protein
MSNETTNQGNPLPLASASATAQGDPVASDATTKSHTIHNPLWVIVIGMACFFGVTAIITAWS